MGTALSKQPFAAGIAINCAMSNPPADCPNTVTLSGSPPNAPISDRTQRNAAT